MAKEWQKMKVKEQERFLKRWLRKVVCNKKNTKLAVQRHIIRHARQVATRDPGRWATSMRNLLATFEGLHCIDCSPATQLERLQNKYQKNPLRYTAPPKK